MIIAMSCTIQQSANMTMVIDCTELLDVFMAKIPTSCDGINAGGYPYK